MRDSVTVRSRRHGQRRFTRIALRPYQRRDGTMTALSIWQGTCVKCGAPYQIAAPINASGSHAFDTVHCPAHRQRRRL
jgi:hypothetical protein